MADTLVAATLGVGLFLTYRAKTVKDAIKSRMELRDRSGVNLRTRNSAAYWGNNDGTRPMQRMRATYEVWELPHPDVVTNPRKPIQKIIAKKEALRTDNDMITDMQVPHYESRRDGLRLSRKYPPMDARAHALRRVNGRSSALSDPDRYLRSRMGEFLLPQK